MSDNEKNDVNNGGNEIEVIHDNSVAPDRHVDIQKGTNTHDVQRTNRAMQWSWNVSTEHH